MLPKPHWRGRRPESMNRRAIFPRRVGGNRSIDFAKSTNSGLVEITKVGRFRRVIDKTPRLDNFDGWPTRPSFTWDIDSPDNRLAMGASLASRAEEGAPVPYETNYEEYRRLKGHRPRSIGSRVSDYDEISP